jgi:exodeoxyribonuclease VII small subunit
MVSKSASGASAASAAAPPPAAGPPAFEQALAQLESLVTRLESGDLPLDEALRTFEHGVQLTRECQGALAAAQQKVQLLLQRGETVAIEDFNPGEDIDAGSRRETAASE